MQQHGVDVGDNGSVRTCRLQRLGCTHGGECDRGRRHPHDAQLRRYADFLRATPPLAACAHSLFCAAPVVSAASANAVPSGGSTVTIGGLSFGTDGRPPTASLTASDACGSSAWTSATTVVCAPQAHVGTAWMQTAVSVSAVAGTVLGQFSFDGTGAWLAAVVYMRMPQLRRHPTPEAQVLCVALCQRRV